MIHWLLPPKLFELSQYIACYWFLDQSHSTSRYDHPKLNPDPSAHLILTPPEQAYHYSTDKKISSGFGSHWLYPHSDTLQLDHSKSFICLGIKFHVGALYSLQKVDFTKKLLGTVCHFNFEDIAADSQLNENELLAIAKTEPDKCYKILNDLFTPWFLNSYEDQHSQLTKQILPLLENNLINELNQVMACSQRTLERSFLKVTGLTLKQCQAMNKLEAILEYLYQRDQSDINWVDIAYQFGFSDQPHFIRYLKKYINLTPKNYVSQRGFTIDLYGGVNTK